MRDGLARRLTLALLVLAGAAASARPLAAAVPEWRAPRSVTRTLPNGLRVIALPAPGSGLVSVLLRIPAGVAAEPADAAGVSAVTLQLLRSGTTVRAADRLAADLDRLASDLQAVPGREDVTLGATFLARDLEDGLSLVADVVMNPLFPEADLRRAIAGATARLLEAHQDPAATADQQIWEFALPGVPAARSTLGTTRGLRRLDRDRVRAFHRERYRPGGSTLIVAGDVDSERAFQLAAEWFDRWSGTAEPIVAPAAPAGSRVLVVDQPGGTRCEVRVARVAPGRTAPDHIARTMAVDLLERQLARGPGGRHTTLSSIADRALWIAAGAGPVDSAASLARALSAALAAGAKPPAAAALAEARRLARSLFPQGFETLAGRAARWSAADLAGYGDGWVERWMQAVESLTPEAVGTAASRELGAPVIVAVGPAARLAARLAPLGTVEVRELDDVMEMQSPARAVRRASAEDAERGRQIVKLAVDAHGGLAALARARESVVESEITLISSGQAMHGQLRQLRKDPWRYKVTTTIETARTSQVLNGREAWSVMPGDSALEMADSAGVADLRSAFEMDVVHLLVAASDTAARAAWRGRERVGDLETDRVDVLLGTGDVRRLYVDVQSRRLAAADLVEPGALFFAPTRWLYRDYRDNEGVWWPFEEQRIIAGQPFMALRHLTVQFHAGLRDEEFQAPASVPRAPGR